MYVYIYMYIYIYIQIYYSNTYKEINTIWLQEQGMMQSAASIKVVYIYICIYKSFCYHKQFCRARTAIPSGLPEFALQWAHEQHLPVPARCLFSKTFFAKRCMYRYTSNKNSKIVFPSNYLRWKYVYKTHSRWPALREHLSLFFQSMMFPTDDFL